MPGREGQGPNDKPTIYYNQIKANGTFRRAALTVGSNGFPRTESVVAGDYDNDGDIDLFLARPTQSHAAVLLRNNGVPVPGNNVFWEDQSSLLGPSRFLTQSGVWADVDNDGDLDLFITRTSAPNGQNQPNILLINQLNESGVFVDETDAAGLAGPLSADSISGEDSVAWGNFNRDGKVDFVLTVTNDTRTDGIPQSVFLYRNNSIMTGNWFTIRLFDLRTKNYRAIGAKVELTTGIPVCNAIRVCKAELNSATTFRSQGPQYLHFGLGGETSINSIKVTWPDGAIRIINGPFVVNKHKKITRKLVAGMEEITVEDLP